MSAPTGTVRPMPPLDYLTLLRREFDDFAACLDGDLAAPVAHCGDWTLYDLASHLGRGNLWAGKAITERRSDHPTEPPPREPAALTAWFGHTCDTLLDALQADPATEAWTFHPPHTVGFWRRRRCQETLIHRWDAEHALGRDSTIDPGLAGDGVAEVIEIMLPRQTARGRIAPPRQAVRLVAADTGAAWTLGPGEPVATLSGTAAELLLTLWGRHPYDDPALTWKGDRDAGGAVLAGPLTP